MNTLRDLIIEGLNTWGLRGYEGIVRHMERSGYERTSVVAEMNLMIDKGEIIHDRSGVHLP